MGKGGSRIVSGFSRVLAGAATIAFPAHCALCGHPYSTLAQPICQKCAGEVALIGSDVCLRCGRGHGEGVGMTTECYICAENPKDWPFEMTVTAGNYDGRLRDLILALKFGRHHALAALAGSWLAQAVAAKGVSVDVVVPIPLAWYRRIERGFNQSAWIARQVSETLGLGYVERGLARKGFRPPQRGLSEEERRANPKGAFRAGRGIGRVRGKRVLLVDDVLTTGATLRDARRVLMKAGATAVIAAVVARTRVSGRPGTGKS